MSTETNHARDNAQSWAQTIADMIADMMAALETCEDCEQAEAAQEAIQEAPLSVEVRSGWYRPCDANPEPMEYQILLSTGGPALRITGQLGAHGEAGTAHMEYQDWGTPWTRYHPAHGEPLFDSHNADVLTFAQQFYFAE